MEQMTMDDVVYLCDARWEEGRGRRIVRTPVHVYRHRTTGELHVITYDDERAVNAPTYRVQESELVGLPAGGLPG